MRVTKHINRGESDTGMENELGAVRRFEVGPEGAARLVRVERFSEKDSSNQCRNVPENNLHAQSRPLGLI